MLEILQPNNLIFILDSYNENIKFISYVDPWNLQSNDSLFILD